jgi:hypothetical protein
MANGAMLGFFIMLQSVVLWFRGKSSLRIPEWVIFRK